MPNADFHKLNWILSLGIWKQAFGISAKRKPADESAGFRISKADSSLDLKQRLHHQTIPALQDESRRDD
jgi:hypothetical protein